MVRVGETVRRATGSWSPAVHGLLRHIEERGFDGAPRFFGLDEDGREVLSFVVGEVGNYPLPPYMWSEATLVGAARLLRRYHDATAGYVPPAGASWRLEDPGPPHEVICHNDFAPYNVVFVDGRPCAIIDFDTAGPGPRVWDVAYTAYRFVPLSHDQHSRALGLTGPVDSARRLRLFCDAYGLEPEPRRALPGVAVRRLEALCNLMTESAARGDEWAIQVIADGHLDAYSRDIEHLRAIRQGLIRNL